jgi:hypothetical protein
VNIQWASGGLRSHERQARDGLAGFLHKQGRGAQKITPPNGCILHPGRNNLGQGLIVEPPLAIHPFCGQNHDLNHSRSKTMSKGMDSKKQTKKAPEKTMKEKRAAKRAKKAARGSMG